MSPLNAGDHVFVKQGKNTVRGVVIDRASTPRSYLVKTPKGVLRRNRSVLFKPRRQPVFAPNQLQEEADDCDFSFEGDDDVIDNRFAPTLIESNSSDLRRSNRNNRGVPPPRYGITV